MQAAGQNAPPWALALSKRVTLRGTKAAAACAFGEQASSYIQLQRLGRRKVKHEKRRLDGCRLWLAHLATGPKELPQHVQWSACSQERLPPMSAGASQHGALQQRTLLC